MAETAEDQLRELRQSYQLLKETWGDADQWGWNVDKDNKPSTYWSGHELWLSVERWYEYCSAIERAIFVALQTHVLGSDSPPAGYCPKWALSSSSVDDFINGIKEIETNGKCPGLITFDTRRQKVIEPQVVEPVADQESDSLVAVEPETTPVPVAVIDEEEEEADDPNVRPEFKQAIKLLEQLNDPSNFFRGNTAHLLNVFKQTKEELLPLWHRSCTREETTLFWSLIEAEETLEWRLKAERKRRLLAADPEELPFLDLLKVIYFTALDKDINAYQAASTQMRRRFGKTEQALKPDLLKLLRDEHAESAYSVGAVDLNKIHSLEYALEGFIPNEEVTHVFAPWGDGKTALALGMTKALIKGTGFLDQQVGREPQSVLYINTDAGAGRFKSAFEELNMDSDQRFTSGEWLTIWAPDASQGKEGWSASLSNFIALREAIEDGGYGVVIIDSVKGMLSGTGYDYQDNQTVNQMVKMLREVIAMPCECAVVLINHKETDEKEGAGAKAWSEATGQVIELKTPQGKDKQPLRHLREVIIRKDSISGRRRMFTKLENGEHVVTEGTEVVKDGTDLVLQWFKSKAVAGKPKWQRKDVIAEESGLVPEVSVPTVDRALKALSGHAGQLKKLKGGWYELKAQHS